MLAVAIAALSSLAAAAPPALGDAEAGAERLARAHPRAHLVPASAGGLEHASAFAEPRLASGDEEAARLFLGRHGRAFGVTDPTEDLEVLRLMAGRPGAAVFRRRAQGLPVFGGEVVVGWRADGMVHFANGSPTLALAPRGAFRVGLEAARSAALAAAPGQPRGEAMVEKGWREFEANLYPVYRVSHSTREPLDAWRTYVDGETGRVLFSFSGKRSLGSCPAPPCIRSYLNSPLAPPPAPDGGYPVEDVPALGLTSGVPDGGAVLTGERTAVYNCRGADFARIPDGCPFQTRSDPSGSFLADPDASSRVDAFAEQSAYYHIDAQSRFLDQLDPAFAALHPGVGGIGFIASYVNALQGGEPLDNAFFVPAPSGPGLMVYGQGTDADLAYDAEIVFHELTHAAIDATARFEPVVDGLGLNVDPLSLGEGTADTFAFANPASLSPCLSPYFGSALGSPCLRNADNRRTCRGNGGGDTGNPGRIGEEHADGQIWAGFAWSLFRAAMDEDAARGGGTIRRDAMASALFQAMEQATSHPSFEAYAATVQAVAASTMGPEAAALVACAIAQRDLAGCADRTMAVFGGERAQGVARAVTSTVSLAPQQYFVDVPCRAARLHVRWSDKTGRGTLYLRYGQPVRFKDAALTRVEHDWVLVGTHADTVLEPGGCFGCDLCGARTPLGPGRWYFLPAASSDAAFELGVSLEMEAGADPPPVRQPYLFGPGQSVNQCRWGGGSAPQPLVPPVSAAPPLLTCSGPVPPVGGQPAACSPPPPAAASSSSPSCSCATASPAAALLPLVALLFCRRRPPGLPRTVASIDPSGGPQ